MHRHAQCGNKAATRLGGSVQFARGGWSIPRLSSVSHQDSPYAPSMVADIDHGVVRGTDARIAGFRLWLDAAPARFGLGVGQTHLNGPLHEVFGHIQFEAW